MAVALGILGKHPAFGDFVQAGLTERTVSTLSLWLDRSLSQLRGEMGDAWPVFWDGAQGLRFWIGPGVAGLVLAGVMIPSRDRVGRRFPLLLMAEGAGLELPMMAPEQEPWEVMEAHLARAVPQAGVGARSLLDGLVLDLPHSEEMPNPMLWAHRTDGDLVALLRAAGRADPGRAALPRSYWWAPGGPGRSAVWLGCDGLPAGQALGWLLGGVAGEAPPAGETRSETSAKGG